MRFLLALLTSTLLVAADDHHHHHYDPIGTATVAGASLAVAGEGKPKAGGEWAVQVTPAAGTPRPKAVRLWVGTADAAGSVKARAKRHHGAYEAHVEVPKPLPATAALWISIEASDGTTTTGSVALPKP